MSTEVAIREQFAPASIDTVQVWGEEMQGAQVEFLTVSTPTAGGTTWEVEGEDPSKELRGVVVDDYEAHVLYLQGYSGEGRAPDGYWIAGECQYLSDDARKAGYSEGSVNGRDEKIQNRQVLYLARAGQIVPIRVDLTGASCRPWRTFKQNTIVNLGKRVTSAALGLSLEAKKYPSGFSGSLIAPKLLGWLDDEQAAAYLAQREQIRPFTRVRTAPAGDGDQAAVPVEAVAVTSTNSGSREDAVANLQASFAATEVKTDDDIPF